MRVCVCVCVCVSTWKRACVCVCEYTVKTTAMFWLRTRWSQHG